MDKVPNIWRCCCGNCAVYCNVAVWRAHLIPRYSTKGKAKRKKTVRGIKQRTVLFCKRLFAAAGWFAFETAAAMAAGAAVGMVMAAVARVTV